MAEKSSCTHMPDKLGLRGIGAGVLVVVASIVVALIAAFVVMRIGEGATPPRLAAGLRPPPSIAGPVKLQLEPAQDIAAFRAEKRAKIETYGWVDRDRGIARIPIDRAMAILAGQGQGK